MAEITSPALITAGQAAARLQISRHLLAKLVSSGRLAVAQTLPGERGARLFASADVDRVALELAEEAEARAAELRESVAS